MHPSQRASSQQQHRFQTHAQLSDAYGFFNQLTAPGLLESVESLLPTHRERLFPPTETLSMFLAQAMDADRSCQNAVNHSAIKRHLGGLPVCSTHTGAYCRARMRLATALPATLVRTTGQQMAEQAAPTWHWRGRPVRLVDGTIVSLPDTAENQARYPQPGSQRAGLGFPQCRMVGLFCRGSAALLDMAMGPCRGKGSDEQTLLRSLLGTLDRGDVLLGDAFYPTYFLLWSLQRRGVDGVFEQHGSRRRTTDFRRGKWLAKHDHLIEIHKPGKKPDWMDQQDYEQCPDSLTVREVKTGGKLLVTTLLCPKSTHKKELKRLYKDRWQVEVDFRNIKTTLGMHTLSCRTPSMVEKEIWVYLLAYNLIRQQMAQAAILADVLPRELSFKHTLQLWSTYLHMPQACDDNVPDCLLRLIGQQRVGKRPGRIEPRAIKRRPKQYSLLTKPRDEARQDIRENGHPKKLK